MAICPLAVDWGNVADWAGVLASAFAGITTLLAVAVAFISSKTAIHEARRMRNEDREHRAEAERLRAVARAIAFDHEFFGLGGLLSEIHKRLKPVDFEEQPLEALRWVIEELPKDPMPLLTRFAGELDAFGPKDSSTLLGVVSGWNAIGLPRDPIDVETYNDHQARRLLHAMRGGLAVFLDHLRDARQVTMRWVAEVKSDAPATDW